MTNGQILSLILTLSKGGGIEYDGVNIVGIATNATKDGLIFILQDGKRIEHKFNSVDAMKLSDFDKNNNGIIDIAEVCNVAKDSEKLGGKLPSFYAKTTEIPKKISELENDSGFVKINDLDESGIIPKDANSENKLVTNDEMRKKISEIKFSGLLDVDKPMKSNSFLMTNDKGNRVTYLSSIKDMIKIQKIIDKDGKTFTDIPYLKFDNLIGTQNEDGSLNLKDNIFSTDLKDMPKSFIDGNVLVSNGKTMKYELKDVGSLTNSKANFVKSVGQIDWYYDPTLEIYTTVIKHQLDSKNLIIAIYDMYNEIDTNTTWKIIDQNQVLVKSNTDRACRVVINCSQGVANNSSIGGVWTITPSEFIMQQSCLSFATSIPIKIIETTPL